MGETAAEAIHQTAERLYYDSPALTFEARVTDIRLVATEADVAGVRSHVWQVSLNRTAFYPESGGQPWDTGVLVATARSGATLEVQVERVTEDEAGEVWHQIRKPLEQGTAVTGQVNAARRGDHTQQHSGQHLLSAVFWDRLRARTVSFHLGAEVVTIDLALPEGTDRLTPEQLHGVEDEVNRLIFENRPLLPRWHPRADAEAMLARGELRKLPERTGPMRIVEMQGVEFNACGGTHVSSTGAIGGLLLRGTDKVKAGVRVSFVCGLRAVAAARAEHDLLTGIGAGLSTTTAAIPERLAKLQEETKVAGKERRALLEELAAVQAERLLGAFAGPAVVHAIFAGKSVDFLKRVASLCATQGRIAVVGGTEGSTASVVLAVPARAGVHAGTIVREVLALFEARGGGSAEIAQGVCPPERLAEIGDAIVARFQRPSEA